MRAVRHLYEVDGWGVGELWHNEGVVVQHELASMALAEEAAALTNETAALAGGDGSSAAALRHRAAHEVGAGRRAAVRPGPALPHEGARSPSGTLTARSSPARDPFATDVCRRFASHLRGRRVSYDDVALDLAWATPFQAALATAARAIPWGEVASYGELAAIAGRPGAARAAGSFCADNRFSLVIPCHRIVAANGIGGYGAGGPALKRRLLALEGVTL